MDRTAPGRAHARSGLVAAEFAEPKEDSGMGSGIGMWLLYRAGDGSLAFSSLVVPAGAHTPIHDHLAWGLVGLYRGKQDEIVYTRTDDGSVDDVAKMDVHIRRSLEPGDYVRAAARYRYSRSDDDLGGDLGFIAFAR